MYIAHDTPTSVAKRGAYFLLFNVQRPSEPNNVSSLATYDLPHLNQTCMTTLTPIISNHDATISNPRQLGSHHHMTYTHPLPTHPVPTLGSSIHTFLCHFIHD
jgi:hypothetical protein